MMSNFAPQHQCRNTGDAELCSKYIGRIFPATKHDTEIQSYLLFVLQGWVSIAQETGAVGSKIMS